MTQGDETRHESAFLTPSYRGSLGLLSHSSSARRWEHRRVASGSQARGTCAGEASRRGGDGEVAVAARWTLALRGDGGDFGRRLGQGVSKGSSACAVLRAAGHHNPMALRVEYKSEGVQTTSPFILTWLRSLVIK